MSEIINQEPQQEFVMVYFKNHKVVKFPKDKLMFFDPYDGSRFYELLEEGKSIVNWENVSFVRKWDPQPKDELNEE